jgi:hypothetical protein
LHDQQPKNHPPQGGIAGHHVEPRAKQSQNAFDDFWDLVACEVVDLSEVMEAFVEIRCVRYVKESNLTPKYV